MNSGPCSKRSKAKSKLLMKMSDYTVRNIMPFWCPQTQFWLSRLLSYCRLEAGSEFDEKDPGKQSYLVIEEPYLCSKSIVVSLSSLTDAATCCAWLSDHWSDS